MARRGLSGARPRAVSYRRASGARYNQGSSRRREKNETWGGNENMTNEGVFWELQDGESDDGTLPDDPVF